MVKTLPNVTLHVTLLSSLWTDFHKWYVWSTHAKDLDWSVTVRCHAVVAPSGNHVSSFDVVTALERNELTAAENGIFHFIVCLPTRKLLNNDYRFNFPIAFVWFDQPKIHLSCDRIPTKTALLYANQATVFLKLGSHLNCWKKLRKIIDLRPGRGGRGTPIKFG